mgnify:CR=1 FL=1
MKPKFLLYPTLAITLSGATFVGCVDNDYDLANIDGTTQMQVKNLILPINIDEISMANIIDLDDSSHIQVINGEYVLIDSGTYESDEIIVSAINAKAPQINPVYSKINLLNNSSTTTKAITSTPSLPLIFEIGEQMSKFSYQESGVSEFIVDIDMIMANFDITIDLVVEGLKNNIKSWTMEDLKIQLPKGLTGEPNMGIYDPETGIASIGSQKVEGTSAKFIMSVTEVDIDKAGAKYENQTLTLDDDIGIRSGFVTVRENDITSIANIPTSANFNVFFAMEDINVDVFGGEIQYKLSGIDITDVPITGIPDVLSQNQTNISLVNPQVYICFSNPLGVNFGLYAQTGLTLTAKRPNEPDQSYSIDNEYFKLACAGCQGCQFCLSPTDPGQGNYWGKFVNAEHVPFTSLANLLSGNGLPKTIGIKLDNPCIPKQKIGHFPLGANLGRVSGCYTIFAPLQLKQGSKIIYTSTEDGWYDEEIAKITISDINVDMLITNDLPVDINLTGYPIDVNGNKINNVTVESINVKTGTDDEPITLKIKGEIKNLDGITFTATATTPQDKSLRPEEHIVLKNVKVKISGVYQTEL